MLVIRDKLLWSLLAIVMTLSGCGLKGPLYLPDKKPAADSPASPQSTQSQDPRKSAAPAK